MTTIDRVFAGEVICNIGQVSHAERRALDKLAKAGKLVKWRGYWYPDPRWPEGIGPLKSCWALPHVRNMPPNTSNTLA